MTSPLNHQGSQDLKCPLHLTIVSDPFRDPRRAFVFKGVASTSLLVCFFLRGDDSDLI